MQVVVAAIKCDMRLDTCKVHYSKLMRGQHNRVHRFIYLHSLRTGQLTSAILGIISIMDVYKKFDDLACETTTNFAALRDVNHKTHTKSMLDNFAAIKLIVDLWTDGS